MANIKRQTIVVKGNGEREPFDSSKLVTSLKRAGATDEAVSTVLKKVEKVLKDGISTSSIYRQAFRFLAKTEKRVAARYSIRRAVADLGPSGYAFEDFFAEIMRARGFTALTRQIVMGGCVAHEVDVVAYNDHKLIMAEAKFHHETTFKSDLKVVLYVKERFDDLSANTFDYGKKRTLDEGWLVTNTKFTSTAIQYAECKNIPLIGWNYPRSGNLQDLIEETNLHPITCLPSLSGFEKDLMFRNGLVLCQHVLNRSDVLVKAGIQAPRINEILEEMRHIYSKPHN